MSDQKPTDPIGSMFYELRMGWLRFWGLSWWWKGSAFAVIALIAIVVIASRGGDDGSDPFVFDAANLSSTPELSEAGGVGDSGTSGVEGGEPAKRGAFTLSLQNIKGRLDYNYSEEWANYTFDIVIEAESDVGGTITQTQTCLIDIHGRESYIWHGCDSKEPREYRIEPHGRFTIHVDEWWIRGTPRSSIHYDDLTIKYWGTDDGGNPIYLDISLNYWDVFGGPFSAPEEG